MCWGDPDDLAGAACGFERRGDAAVPGAGAVETEQIRMPFEQLRREQSRALAVIAPLEHR